MTNITLHTDKEKGINVSVRKIKNYSDNGYFYAIEITVNDTHVTVYVDKIADIIKMTNNIDRSTMQLMDGE